MSGAKDGLFFVHIPRTAGTSFRYYLNNFFSIDDIIQAGRAHALLNSMPFSLIADRSIRTRLVIGHISPCYAAKIVRPLHLVTVFREPVSRVVSYINYEKKLGNIPMEATIREALGMRTTWISAINGQSMLISGLLAMEAGNFPDITSSIDRYLQWQHESGLLERVRETLAKFSFIGLFDDLPGLSAWLTDTFCRTHLEEIPSLPKINAVTKSDAEREQLAEAKDLLEAILECDRIVYSEVSAQYSARQGTSWHRNPTVGASFFCDMAAPLFGYNWREARPDNSGGYGGYRWTGEDTLALINVDLAEAETDMWVEFEVIDSVSPKNLEEMRCEINNTQVPLFRIPDWSGAYFGARVRQEVANRRRPLEIKILFPETASIRKASFFVEPGDFQCGVALRYILIRPFVFDQQIGDFYNCAPLRLFTELPAEQQNSGHFFSVPQEFSLEGSVGGVFHGLIVNTSNYTWTDGGRKADSLKVGAKVYAGDSGKLVAEFRGLFEPGYFAPGASYTFSLPIAGGVLSPGLYRLRLGMVKENAYWLSDRGAREHEITLLVR